MDIGFIYNYMRFGHIVCMVLWAGGMIYLPLVMKAHAAQEKPEENTAFIKLERFLMRGMMNPAMILTFIFGISLAAITKAGSPGNGSWIHAKLLLVLMLSYFHMKLSHGRKQLENGTFTRTAKLFERISAWSAILVLLAVYLAVVKPF